MKCTQPLTHRWKIAKVIGHMAKSLNYRLRADTTTLEDMLRIAHRELGQDAVLELDQELVLALNCPNCGTREEVLQPISAVGFNRAHCPTCGILRETELSHAITGNENFLTRTLASVGVPALHIVRAYNAQEYRFYELTGDLPDALHFSHFELPALRETDQAQRAHQT